MRQWLLLIMCVAICLGSWTSLLAAVPGEEKAEFDKAMAVPLDISGTKSEIDFIWGNVQRCVLEYKDSVYHCPGLLTATDCVVETLQPRNFDEVGFRVTKSPTPQGARITVQQKHFSDNVIAEAKQKRDAEKRAHMLAYQLSRLLNEYRAGDSRPSEWQQSLRIESRSGIAITEFRSDRPWKAKLVMAAANGVASLCAAAVPENGGPIIKLSLRSGGNAETAPIESGVYKIAVDSQQPCELVLSVQKPGG